MVGRLLSVVYRSTVCDISVNCRSNISRVLIYKVSPMAFFLSKDVINYCYHAMGGTCGSARRDYSMKLTEEHWELRTW